MTEEVFLADTYALIELIGGNPNYQKYTNNLLLTTNFNLAELYYALLRDYDQETAEKYLKLYLDFLIPITPSSIQWGMQFKLKYRKDKLSYTDCVGYALAFELNIKFLTGDQKFETMPNVEFVK